MARKPRKKNKWKTYAYLALVLMLLGLFGPSLFMIATTSRFAYSDLTSLPENQVGLVLGTSNMLTDGRPNTFYRHRVEAAAELYRAGKVKHLILSGHHSSRHYSEPLNMKKDLIALGVAEEDLTLDGAGYRTLDSLLRAKNVHGLKKVTIISQQDHNFRALYIARHLGIEAVAFAARPSSRPYNNLRVGSREVLARIRAMLDLYLWGTEAREPEGPGPIE